MTETVNDPRPDAGGRSGKGLTMRRVYTRLGVHPYDEVRWERRDVVMTNWRDGSVNFEQRGVEFPDFWSVNAVNIVTSKYFRGAVGTPEREWSLKQLIDRVVATYVQTGKAHGYFASDDDAEIFDHELKHALVHQIFSFNSPVWFNVGTSSPSQVSACFILSVDDTMESILDWYKEEGLIFKGGSGSGVNLSRIRSKEELLSSGGTASGPVSFMRGADASAGTIKSGGATRRAAKMVVLDVDHPDVEEFVETKAREEHKIRALRDAGYDMDLDGKDMASVQYQNANNSVRVSDEFMRAVERDLPFSLRARTTGEPVKEIKARDLFRQMAQAAWECADPGLQYDDTINDWHTAPESGRITASNPCFPADQRVVTDKGLVRIGDLVERAAQGEAFAVYTNDVTAQAGPAARVVPTRPVRYMVTGTNEIVELRFYDGSRLRCTPNHRVWTADGGWVTAEDLTPQDRVVRSFHYAPRSMASGTIPSRALEAAGRVQTRKALTPPEKWDDDLAHYLGWLVGDGCVTEKTAVTVYGSPEDKTAVMPRHHALLERITGFASKPSVQANGTYQLRVTRRALAAFARGLGVSSGRSADKRVPEAIFEAPEEALVDFLQGLYDADGCVVNDERKGTRYVGLGSRSEALVLGVQELLASLGIASRVHTMPPKRNQFSYVRKDGSEVTYGTDGPSYDLRISGRSLREFAALIGFSLPRKDRRLRDVIDLHDAYDVDETVRLVSRTSQGFETTYNLTEPRNHSYIVGGTVVANCSEYLHLDNSSCNLASLNLLKFLREDGTFDTETFVKVVELVITAMDISVTFADFPTEKITETTRAFRQLGIGYANLGALLMATGHAYDSDGGRALAAAITSLMTGTAYKRSAELAGVVGPYDGYAKNAESHKRVMRKHAAASDAVRSVGEMDHEILEAASDAWKRGLEIGEKNGWRNAQASVLAPTGCLTGDTMVTTDRGLTRLSELGDSYGDRWQDLDAQVSTDEGPRQATRFFVNGEEPTRSITTWGGYRIQGTLTHRVKVVDMNAKEWVWKRLADIEPGDILPMQMGTFVGEPRRVPLPVLDQAYYTGDPHLRVPDHVDSDLAELNGYFMGDGSLHAKGIRLCVADTDLDEVERLKILSKGLFGIEPVVRAESGYHEVSLQSIRLARWWRAAGLGKEMAGDERVGKGWHPRVPSAILEANDPAVYAAFLRGLFEADGTVLAGVPSVSTASAAFASEVRTMLLALGLPTTTRETTSGWGGPQFQVRLRNVKHAKRFEDRVGFLSARKSAAVVEAPATQGGDGSGVRSGYLYEEVAANEDGGVQPTYDLSVPDNVTYVASGFVSHNTIGLMMDCDTTGIEPDLALVKMKKLVGGGSMRIVNQTVPRALELLGYQQEQIEAVVDYIAEHGHVINAPGLREEHYDVFDCAMGERSISPMGHVRMVGAVQPFLSGSASKTINLPESATVEDIEQVYREGWQLGLKALAVYRDNCKVGQPLSVAKHEEDEKEAEVARPVRRRLPKTRPSQTTSFSVGGAEGYMTASSYPDNGLGEVFLKLGKQGSTLAGVMDAFSIAISVALQYGIPLETYVSKFTNMRFEPSGLTDDPDIRMASSAMDYIFRRLALDHLPYETRAEMGIFTAQERARALETGSYEVEGGEDDLDPESLAQSAAVELPREERPRDARPTDAGSSTEVAEAQHGRQADAPLCLTCGTKMRPAGSCYVCEGCGSTSGCS
ncbi:MAG: LAGLIDADG family homing endonuclease [Streptosporangiaceae bacterium]